MKKTIFSILTICATALVYVSCSSSDDNTGTVNQTDISAVGVSVAIDATNEMDINTALLVTKPIDATGKSADNPTTGICATITVSPTTDTYPKVFTVDYGTTGCTNNQLTRKGKLKITLTGPVTTTGSKMTIERIDYSINGLKLQGTIEYTNTTTVATIPKWTRTVTNGKFTDLQGRVYTNSGTQTVQQTAGVDTPFVLDDNVYEMIDGNNTVTSDKVVVTMTIQEALVKKYSCTFISKGKLKIKGSLLNGVIDYGNNDCDSKYTYTLDSGAVFQLVM